MNVDPSEMGTNFFRMKITSPLPEFGGATVMIIENNERRLLQLNNDGQFRTREVFVDSYTPWPDYVFESNYSLPKLADIKNYILINKHLPNVPTAKEISEDGINLGEMNRILLEKVEELTLYLIEQQERIEKLEIEVEQLK